MKSLFLAAVLPCLATVAFADFINRGTPTIPSCETDDFFKFTKENLDDSRAIYGYWDWYRDHVNNDSSWAKTKVDPDLEKYGEAGLFGLRVLNVEGYSCGHSLLGCSPSPSCEDILSKFPDRNEARKQYFMSLMVKYVFQIQAIHIAAADSVRIEVTNRILDLVRDFTENNDAQALSICGAKDSIIAAIQKGSTYRDNYRLRRQPEFGVPELYGVVPTLARRGSPSKGDLALADVFANRGCDSSTGSFIVDIRERQKAVEKLIGSYFDVAIAGIRDDMLLAARGGSSDITINRAVQDRAFLAHLDPETMTPRPDFQAAVESAMKERVYESIMSALLLGERCFAKCVYTKDPQETINRGHYWWLRGWGWSNTDTTKSMGKYRFAVGENRVCQWECLTHDKRPMETRLSGIHKFKNYGLDFLNISTAAFYQWWDPRTFSSNIAPGFWVAGIVPPVAHSGRTTYATHDPSLNESRFELPICDSQFNVMNDLTIDQKDSLSQTMMPVCCGDWRCSETPAFMSALNINASNPEFKEYFERQVPAALAQTVIRPYTHFNALCKLGWSYPLDLITFKNMFIVFTGRKLLQETHYACNDLAEATKDMDEDHANLHFCRDPKWSRIVDQTSGINSFRAATGLFDGWPSYKEMCNDLQRLPNPDCMRTDEENFLIRSDPLEEQARYGYGASSYGSYPGPYYYSGSRLGLSGFAPIRKGLYNYRERNDDCRNIPSVEDARKNAGLSSAYN